MSYRVVFAPIADRDLVDLWLESDYQKEITVAVDDLVRRLQANPIAVGESRGENRRIAFQWPVGIQFEVDSQLNVVNIFQFWIYAKRDN